MKWKEKANVNIPSHFVKLWEDFECTVCLEDRYFEIEKVKGDKSRIIPVLDPDYTGMANRWTYQIWADPETSLQIEIGEWVRFPDDDDYYKIPHIIEQ